MQLKLLSLMCYLITPEGKEIAAACLRRTGVNLAPFGLTGEDIGRQQLVVDDGEGGQQMNVQLYPLYPGGVFVFIIDRSSCSPRLLR